MKNNILKILTRLPFTLGYIAAALVLVCVFGVKGMAGEITGSVKTGLAKDLITIERADSAQGVASADGAAGKTDNGAAGSNTTANTAADGTSADNAAGTSSDGTAYSSNTADAGGETPVPAQRGTCQYVYDGSQNTGDADHDSILASENNPEVFADSLDQFGNVLPGAAAPAGTFTYSPETGINTAFLSYDPEPVDSKYYSDPGEHTFTTAADYVTVDDSYFTDALFIGDSRTVGLFDYGAMPADFFCDRGYCTYNFIKQKTAVLQNTGAEMTLEQCLSAKQYKKIYIILGINDSGYGSRNAFADRYKQMLAAVKAAQPDAIIYVCANMYFAPTFEDKLGVMNNVAVRDKNYTIAQTADGVTTFYLNYNGMFCDTIGNLRKELTQDGAHLMGRYYALWSQYFRHHAIQK